MSDSTFGLEVVTDLFNAPFIRERTQILDYEFAKKRSVLPIDEQDGVLLVAISDPLDLELIDEVRLMTGKEVKEVLADGDALTAAIEECYHQSESATIQLLSELEKGAERPVEDDDGYDLLAQSGGDSSVVRLLNAILLEAIQEKASDIHFEPQETHLVVRYRIDGVLQVRHRPPKEYQSKLLTRIKVMARLDIAEQRLPQDGRIKLKLGTRQIDFRVSTLPVVQGERVVLRILDKGNVLLGLDKIGMRPDVLETFSSLIQMNEGIVLVTGPTGSGKTTTLYSALSEIQSDNTNIMTIEDPVEYKLASMAQIGVNPKIGLTFGSGLRHILRQDPDVIMIGEIRDKETAEIAIQAALTGHLVLSTLHTNDAPSALTRLVDMGIEPYLLSSSVIGVLAQRLVRTLCPSCRGDGCEVCHDTGYKGRRGIYELMPMTGPLRSTLVETADSSALLATAIQGGMETLRQDGDCLVQEAITTKEEVLRVTRGVEE